MKVLQQTVAGACAYHDGIVALQRTGDFNANRLFADGLNLNTRANSDAHLLGLQAKVLCPKAWIDGFAIRKMHGAHPCDFLAQTRLQYLGLGGAKHFARHVLCFKQWHLLVPKFHFLRGAQHDQSAGLSFCGDVSVLAVLPAQTRAIRAQSRQ